MLGRIADLFLVAGLALRLAHRQGWVSDDLMRSVGLESAVSDTAGLAGIGQSALGVGALWRLLRRRGLRAR